MSVKVKFKKLTPTAQIPRYMTPGSAGMDLYADHKVYILDPGETATLWTGIAVAIPEGYEGQVRTRSGMVLRGLVVANSPGCVDSDFRGEVGVILHNQSDDPKVVRVGDRIAQLVIAPVERAEIEVVDELDATERGDGGFGSTGR